MTTMNFKTSLGTFTLTGADNADTILATGDTLLLAPDYFEINIVGDHDIINAPANNDWGGEITGNYDTLQGGLIGGAISLTGVGETIKESTERVSLGANSSGTFTGDNNIVIGFGDNSSGAVIGNSNTIITSAGDKVTITGNSNSLTFEPAVGVVVQPGGGGNATLTGTGETVTANDSTIGLDGNKSSMTVDGNFDTITASANDAVTINGSSNYVKGGTNDTFVVTGSANSFVLGTGANLQFIQGTLIQGTPELITASQGTISLGSGVSATVTGSQDKINMTEGSGLTLTGNQNTITGTDVPVTLDGNNNTFNLTADPNNENGNPGVGGGRISLYGTNNTVNASYASVFALTNSPGTPSGTTGSVHDSVTVHGTNNKIDFVANMTAEFGSTFNGDFLQDFSDVLKTAVINFHDVSGSNSFKSVLDHATQEGTGMAANTFIAAGGNTLELYDVQISQLSAHNFSFS